jgi:hypothetical protein
MNDLEKNIKNEVEETIRGRMELYTKFYTEIETRMNWFNSLGDLTDKTAIAAVLSKYCIGKVLAFDRAIVELSLDQKDFIAKEKRKYGIV